MNNKTILITLLLAALLLPAASASDSTGNDACAVYFTGIGCSHCARTDPVVLAKLPKATSLVVIEYEIYWQAENSQLITGYNDNYNSGLGIPLIIFNKDEHMIGDTPILQKTTEAIGKPDGNECPLNDGSSVSFNDLDITTLPGSPKIWKDSKILISSGGGGDAELLKSLLTSDNISLALENAGYEIIKPEPVPLSGDRVEFDNAIKIQGWIFQWNGESIGSSSNQTSGIDDKTAADNTTEREKVKLSTLCLIALADTVNPCALAVFILMLIGITTYDPGNKNRKVLHAGLAFVTAVYIMYFFYGLIIIRFIQAVETITNIRPLLTTIFGSVAVLLGLLHLKEVIWYRPGGLLTEMPMRWRPRVKKLMTSITSPKGAFFMGAFVTIFLIPCTMGPYLIAGGILSVLELMETIPWLLIYDLVFILPLIGITFVIHFGFKQVEDVSGWKEKNIKNLHLVTAGIMLFIGTGILLGWV